MDHIEINATLGDYASKIDELRGSLEQLNESSQEYSNTVTELNGITTELSENVETAAESTEGMTDSIASVTSTGIKQFQGLAGAVGGVVPAFRNVQKGWKVLQAAFTSNPWVAVLTVALGVLVGVINKVTNTIKTNEAMSKKWAKAMSAFQPIFDILQRAIDWVATAVINLADAFARNFPKMLKAAGSWAKGFTNVVGFVLDAILYIPSTLAEAINSVMPQIAKFVSSALNGLANALSKINVNGIMDGMISGLRSAATTAQTAMPKVSAAITSGLKGAANAVRNLGKQIDGVLGKLASASEASYKAGPKPEKKTGGGGGGATRATSDSKVSDLKAQADAEKEVSEAAKEASDAAIKSYTDQIDALDRTTAREIADLERVYKTKKARGEATQKDEEELHTNIYNIQRDAYDKQIKLYSNLIADEKILADDRLKYVDKQQKLEDDLYDLNADRQVQIEADKAKRIKDQVNEANKDRIKSIEEANEKETKSYMDQLAKINQQYVDGEINAKQYLKNLEDLNSAHKDEVERIKVEELQLEADLKKQYWEATLAEYGENSKLTEDAYKEYQDALTKAAEEGAKQRIGIAKKEVDSSKGDWESQLRLTGQFVQATGKLMGNVADIYEERMNHRLEMGEIDEETARKEFENLKAMQIAEATLNVLSGALQAQLSVWSPKSGIPTVWAKIAMSALLGVQTLTSGYAQIQKIRNTTFDGGGSSGAGGTNVIVGAATPLLNEAQDINQLDMLSAGTEQPEQKVYVVEADITNAQNRQKVRVQDTTF